MRVYVLFDSPDHSSSPIAVSRNVEDLISIMRRILDRPNWNPSLDKPLAVSVFAGDMTEDDYRKCMVRVESTSDDCWSYPEVNVP